MGVTRTFGLIFFMTLLIGGCILAVSADPSGQPAVARAPHYDMYVALLLKSDADPAGQIVPAGDRAAEEIPCPPACTDRPDPSEEVSG